MPMFDPKKLGVIISTGYDNKKPDEYKDSDSKENDDDDDDDSFEEGTKEAMTLAMNGFIEAIKNEDAGKASQFLKSWCKVDKEYGDHTQPEETEMYKPDDED